MARKYSRGEYVLQIGMGATARGACLTWLSMYPGEQEILYPPLVHIEVNFRLRAPACEYTFGCVAYAP